MYLCKKDINEFVERIFWLVDVFFTDDLLFVFLTFNFIKVKIASLLWNKIILFVLNLCL